MNRIQSIQHWLATCGMMQVNYIENGRKGSYYSKIWIHGFAVRALPEPKTNVNWWSWYYNIISPHHHHTQILDKDKYIVLSLRMRKIPSNAGGLG